jgi:hypothetical protein
VEVKTGRFGGLSRVRAGSGRVIAERSREQASGSFGVRPPRPLERRLNPLLVYSAKGEGATDGLTISAFFNCPLQARRAPWARGR